MSEAASAPVASPCTGVCRIDGATGLCVGCLRRLDEIAAWAGSDDAQRREILVQVGRRRGAAHPSI